MSGRPPANGGATNFKRPATEGNSDEEHHNGPSSSHSGKMKLPRLDRPTEDFSSVIKNRLQSYTRTGQACDRCKVRKIRCDAAPEGCSHCINLGLECFVTDRVTGRTERRGYMQELEREKSDMVSYIRDLENLLGDQGVVVKPWTGPGQGCQTPEDTTSGEAVASDGSWEQVGSVWVKNRQGGTVGSLHITPNFPRHQLPSRAGATNIDFGVDHRPYHSLNGTVINVMGNEIDTTRFEAPDMDEPPAEASGTAPLYNKSEQAFLQSSMGINPPMQVDLPSRKDAFSYAEWYFLIMAAYIPVLHKPSFLRTLERIYDEPGFEPPVAELVQVHMVFAIIYYQYGIRNPNDLEKRNQLNLLSNKHYHFSLSKFFALLSSRELSGVQALTLIASHARSFPKPGCGTMVSNLAFHRAIELNMHREPSHDGKPIPTNLYYEMRKRTWWALLAIQVAVTCRRGRPMPITVEEFDVGYPLPLEDDALKENGVDESNKGKPFSWEVGMATFRIMPIMMEMYANLYSVRRDTQNYTRAMFALEEQLNKWERELPPSLRVDMVQLRKGQQHNLAALYTKTFGLELRLFLRNNSVNPSSDQVLIDDNTRVCEDTARDLLHTVQQVIELKSLDTTWTAMSIYAMALLSMLVGAWDRRMSMSMDQFNNLSKEMNDWFAVMNHLSLLIGSGAGIQSSLGGIVVRTLSWIKFGIEKGLKPTSQSSTSASTPVVRLKKEIPRSDTVISQIPAAAPPLNNPPPSTGPPTSTQQQQQLSSHAAPAPNRIYHQNLGINGHTSYQAINYGDHPQAGLGHPYPPDGMFYPPTAPHVTTTVPTADDGHTSMMNFAPQTAHHVNTNDTLMWQRAAGNTWQDWTAAMANSTQDRFGATALINLGNAVTDPGPRGSVASVVIDGTHTSAHEMTAQWPLVMFDQGPHSQHNPHMHHHATG